jgi:hypothetical protein
MLCVLPAGCFVEHSASNNPPDQNGSISMCPVDTDPAKNITIDTDVGPKLVAGSGEGVSVEYSSGGIWHVQTTCLSGYRCEFEVTAEVASGTVSDVAPENLEAGDTVGSSCPDTAFLSATTDGTMADTDGMIFTTAPGARVRFTAELDHTIYANLIYWASGQTWHNDANANPLDLTPATP